MVSIKDLNWCTGSTAKTVCDIPFHKLHGRLLVPHAKLHRLSTAGIRGVYCDPAKLGHGMYVCRMHASSLQTFCKLHKLWTAGVRDVIRGAARLGHCTAHAAFQLGNLLENCTSREQLVPEASDGVQQNLLPPALLAAHAGPGQLSGHRLLRQQPLRLGWPSLEE